VLGGTLPVGASAVDRRHTTIGDETEIFPFASIGLPPQDLKYRGRDDAARHRPAQHLPRVRHHPPRHAGGGGETTIGDTTCSWPTRTWRTTATSAAHHLRQRATLGGHVSVDDYATISAYSGVHQFCRVGRHAFIGGYSVVTKDALPFAKTVGNRARIYGLNTIGLMRRGFTEEHVGQLKRAYRYLLQSKLNTTQALQQIEQDPTLDCEEVAVPGRLHPHGARGVILRRGGRRSDDAPDD
jgi:UDP-N-acetylglucosamine acyltransferase